MKHLIPLHYKQVLIGLLLAFMAVLLGGCMSPEAESDWRWKQTNPYWKPTIPESERERQQWGPFW